MEERGEIPKGTTHEWAEATPGGVKSLPNRVGKKPASRHKATRGRRALSSHYTPKV